MATIHPDSLTGTRTSLLERVRDLNDTEGWGQFDRLYRPMLVGYAHCRGLPGEAAEEIAQQCLAAIVSRIQGFERTYSFRGWLRGMVDHKVSDFLIERRRHGQADTDGFRETRDPGPSPAEIWQRQWNRAHLRHVLAHLRTNFARHTLQAFWLYVLQERSVEEISRALDMTPNQVYVAKSRVMRSIRERFGDMFESLYGASL